MSSPAVQIRSRLPRLSEAAAAVERARLSVVPRRRTRAARMPFVALVSLVLLGGVVGLLLFNTSMQQASFAATALEEQASTLSARQQTLRMELDVLRDPQHVAVQAQKMGMAVAPNPSFLDLDTGKVMGTETSATAENRVRLLPQRQAKPAILNPAPLVVQAPNDNSRDTSANGAGARGAGGTDEAKPDRPTRSHRR